jgi:23S rRNA pseudouridine1911/1915/1917 synthase
MEEEFLSERLDVYVSGLYPDKSRAFAAKLVDQGRVKVNGAVQVKSSYKIRAADEVSVDFDEEQHAIIPDIDLPVLYEDDDCVVIKKPVGVLTHSKGEFNPEATVATWLASRVTGMTGDRAGIVHRLDRATSGVMICAKTPEALSWLQKQFAQRKTKKTYEAVVLGHLKQPEAVIDMPIERNPKKPQTFRVGSNGKSAVTAYKVLEEGEKYSLVELKPTTGRTHQLRVHLEQLGHPILGDNYYGAPKADRLFLHAKSLELTLPNRERKVFAVPTPKEFKALIK